VKTIINSSKRTYPFKASAAFLACLLFLTFPSCQKDELDQDSMPDMDELSSSALIKKSSSVIFTSLYYIPAAFIIPSEGSLVARRSIGNEYFENFGNSFVLKVQYGSSSEIKISTVEIKINGKLIVTSSDFKKVNLVEKKLNPFTNPAQLDLKIVGTAGSSVELWIEATNKFRRIKDVEGNAYKTVKIGDQWWMAENLKTTKYNDGTPIPFVDDNSVWKLTRTPAYCWYENDENTYKATYGALYKWYTVNTGKLCPTGWHVPSDDEWKILEMRLGMTQEQADAEGPRGTPAGGKLKEIGTIHWLNPNQGANNETGFTAIPVADHCADGIFRGIGEVSQWWSSSDYPSGPSDAWKRFIGYGEANIGRDHPDKADGISVRCLKDY
jgi:uncharacterized protein (TIGR02145 family)